MYEFQTIDGQVFSTAFSPHDITQMWCYDAYDEDGNSHVILTAETNFKPFNTINDNEQDLQRNQH